MRAARSLALLSGVVLVLTACSGGGQELTGPPSGQVDEVPSDAPTGLHVEDGDGGGAQGPLLPLDG